jgi:hypothetical protein
MSPNDPEDAPEGEDEGDGTLPAEHNHTNGAAQPPPVEETRAREPAPPAVAELAASCMRFVFAKYKVPLDFTPDTLGVLDHYVKEVRADLKARPEGQPLIETAVGAYFGEVLRGVFESTWRSEGTYPEWRLSMSEVYLAFNPIGMAREALMLAEAPGWHAHIEMHAAEQSEVARRLASLPEVTDEEYYALTTRFDVVELAVEALRATSRRP